MAKLTEKQKRFCEEYLIDLNATQAAIRAGYKDEDTGRKLTTKKHVLDHITKLRAEQSQRTGITADEVLHELSRIAMTDTEITGKEKLKALELLGKHLGLFSAGSDNSAALEKLDDVLRKIEDGF